MRPELAQLKQRRLFSSPEELLTSEFGFGLTTATDCQRALSYVMAGVPLPQKYLDDPEVMESFGGIGPKHSSREAIILSAVRCGKTLIAASSVVYMTQKVEMPPGIRPGETPRVSLVSKYTDQAQAAFAYLRGAFTTSEPLKHLLLEEPTNDRILVRHPSGAPIEIMVVAGARSGTTLVSRWMAGVIFDEAPRISSEADGVINLEEMRGAVLARMVKGSVIIYVGSPVGATGTIYKMVAENWKNPDQLITVMRGTGPKLNPFWFTPELVEDMRRRDPDRYKTDVLAEFLDPEAALFLHEQIARAMRLGDGVLPEPGRKYTACIDPATRGNSWTFGIADTTDNRRYRVVYRRQWTGSSAEPLSPKAVIAELVPILSFYGLSHCLTDQWAVDALRDIARDAGLELAPVIITPKLKVSMFLGLRARFDADAIELPYDDTMREDLLRVTRRLSGGGDVSIRFTETADGRHADYAAMLAMLCGTYIEESAKETAAPEEIDDWPEPEDPVLDMYEEALNW